ncbi:lytic transglycosylase domain-containing protein [Lentzea nigeriaca]|uniref:lytic transglycosylase domain-containing protein n=1 Tax=Lentzea nigeriaca TaxID=1128665 RepID=UPI00195DF003|nr:lytic murein transglycosylase [Lentzea nigeriaca]MBM7858383.1 membrane-bound lytic murein transglycosylase B [Lentzea nigeriaca]
MVPPPPTKAPARRPNYGNIFGRLVLVLLLIVVVAAAAWGLGALNRRDAAPLGPPPFLVPIQEVEPGAAAPGTASTPGNTDNTAANPLTEWATRVASKTDIPVRALQAYAAADLAMQREAPACRISWSTLAGIGRVESRHGSINGSRLQENGLPTRPIIGVPLDGSPGVRAVRDTDGGRLDGDTSWDRAVGPMQFIPGTWNRWAKRAAADGLPPDPQNIDDAALTAARYLCAGGSRDLGTGQGWWAAVMAYNNSVEYGQSVFSGADAYARASVTQ